MATWLNNTDLASEYAANASVLKDTFNDVFWLADRGLYRDNDTTTLCAQDGNSLAVVFNLTQSAEQVAAISDGLTENWGVYGAVAPELPDNIAPFVGGFEVDIVLLGLLPSSMLKSMRRSKHTSSLEMPHERLTCCIVSGDTCSTHPSACSRRCWKVTRRTGHSSACHLPSDVLTA